MSARSRLLVAVVAGALLVGCPAPRHVSGVVFGGAPPAPGAQAFVKPLRDAKVTWSCPPGKGPAPQSLTTDGDGRFASKDLHQDMPLDCEIVVEASGYTTYRERVEKLCESPQPFGCRAVRAAIQLRSIGPDPVLALPLDLPKASMADRLEVVTWVTLTTNETWVNDTKVEGEAGFLPAARAARAKQAEGRVVIRADRSVPYGHFIHALDVMKQAGFSSFALAVEAGPGAVGGGRAAGPLVPPPLPAAPPK